MPHPESSFAGKKRTLLSYLTKIVGQNEICIKIHISLKHLPKVKVKKVQVLTDIYSTRDKIQHINRCNFELGPFARTCNPSKWEADICG